MWRYSSYSLPENRQPLRLRGERGCLEGREQRGESQAAGNEPGAYFAHHCSLTLIVTVKLLRHLINWYDPSLRLINYPVSVRQIHKYYSSLYACILLYPQTKGVKQKYAQFIAHYSI